MKQSFNILKYNSNSKTHTSTREKLKNTKWKFLVKVSQITPSNGTQTPVNIPPHPNLLSHSIKSYKALIASRIH